MWGLRSEEAHGKDFLTLEIGLTVSQLKPLIRECFDGKLEGGGELTLEATTRLGRNVLCKVTCLPMVRGSGRPRGIILMMEEVGSPDGDGARRGGVKRAGSQGTKE
jgi:two-component system CheB/CheR fusion protein